MEKFKSENWFLINFVFIIYTKDENLICLAEQNTHQKEL